jgi:hypothetical protein
MIIANPKVVLMEAVNEGANEPVGTPNKPPIHFSMDAKAARHNSRLLEAKGYDFEQFLKRHLNTTLNYGSEFCPISQLRKILGNHPNFQELAKVLSNGMDY